MTLVSDERLPKNVRKAILDLHLIDKNGQIFRYAKSVDGKDYHPDPKHYNLVEWKDKLSDALNFLAGGLGSWIDVEIEMAQAYLDETDPGHL